jgi:hypothetical protein
VVAALAQKIEMQAMTFGGFSQRSEKFFSFHKRYLSVQEPIKSRPGSKLWVKARTCACAQTSV